METLIQRIAELEHKLHNETGENALHVKLQLAKCCNFIDTARTRFFCEEIIQATDGNPANEYRIKAQLSVTVALLSNRKITEAINLLKIAEDSALASGNSALAAHVQVYSLMLCPYNNSAKGNELIAMLEDDPTVASDLELQCQYHQSASDFLRESDLQKAGVHLFKALECSKALKEPWMEGSILCKLGILADRRQDEPAAERFYNDALPLLLANDCTQYIYQVHICMAKLMIGRKEYHKAIEYAETAYNQAAGIHFKSAMDFALMHKATALLWQFKINEAEPIVLKLVQDGADRNIQGSLLNMLSNMYIQKGDLQKGIDYAIHSYELRKETIRAVDEMTHNEKMYKLYVRLENYREALKYFELFHNRKLLLANENSLATMAEMQARYETGKKEAELQQTKLQHAESELKALKAQMNPHFIFNSLNSVQEIFFTGDKKLANEHLSRFSQLMRNILKASGRQSISLSEEIDMLNEYLALEQLRLGATFTYNIGYSKQVDVYTLDIPPMILQPFVENAIKHGLQHKEGAKHVEITFTWNGENGLLLCNITDNGIGRKASELINERRTGHQSFATSATARRFEMLNSTTETPYEFSYIDNTDATGAAAGTTVLISIPID